MSPLPLSLPTVLASASPRRRELLLRVLAEFEVDAPDLDEEALIVADPVETAKRLALAKALAVAERHPRKLVIGGDTVVALDSRQFGKPGSAAEAIEMLMALSGREHRVISAIALVWPSGEHVFSDVARVSFRPISRHEAEAYASTGEPLDKAGGYAIQGGAAKFVSALYGELDTVIGLPVSKLRAALNLIDPKVNGRP